MQVGENEAFVTQLQVLDEARVEVRAQKDMLRGRLGATQANAQRARQDLTAQQYHNIDARYRKQQIELKTTEMAISDLEKYHKARRCHAALSATVGIHDWCSPVPLHP